MKYGSLLDDFSIPTMNYSRINKGRVKSKLDYSFFMPLLGSKASEMQLADLILSLKMMQAHIDGIAASGKKRYTFKKYAQNEKKANCKELKGKKLIMRSASIHKKTTFSQIKSAYKGEIEEYNDEQVVKAIESQEDVLLGVAIPDQVAAGGIGPVSAARLLCYKSFVSLVTGKIYTCYGTVMGEFNDPYFRDNEFTKYGVCP